MRSKSAPDAVEAFEKMIEKVRPQKVWSDIYAFKNLCDKRGEATYTTAKQNQLLQKETSVFLQIICTNTWEANGHIITSASYLSLSAQSTHS